MTKQDILKIQNFFKQEMSSDIKNMIVSMNDGTYELFGKYSITVSPENLYIITDKRSLEVLAKLYFLKNAVAWCTLHDNKKKIFEAKKIENLDRMLSSIDFNIEIHKKLSNSLDLDREYRWTQKIKLQEDIRKKKILVKELKTLLNSSKHIQLERFKTLKNNQNSYKQR